MPKKEDFNSTFSKQQGGKKAKIGCGGVVLLIGLCIGFFAIIGQLSNKNNETANVNEIMTSTTTITAPELINTTTIYTPTIEANPTDLIQVSPTDTQILPTSTNTISFGEIIETAKVIDSTVQQVESMLGSSTETLSLGIGEAEEVPDGGESRTYQVGKYTIWVNYNKEGIAKGLQVVDGLLDDGYSLDQWGIILTKIGVDYVGLPDIEAPAARHWKNAYGYVIMMAAEKIDGNVWTVRVYKLP